jgi:hypothetical protein
LVGFWREWTILLPEKCHNINDNWSRKRL